MINLISRYNAHLRSIAESKDAASRWFAVNTVAFPWLAPLLLLVIDPLFHLAGAARYILGAVVLTVCLGGIIYACSALVIYGVRADVRRLKDSTRAVDRDEP